MSPPLSLRSGPESPPSLLLSLPLSGMHQTWQTFTFSTFHELSAARGLRVRQETHRSHLLSICPPLIGCCGTAAARGLLGKPVNHDVLPLIGSPLKNGRECSLRPLLTSWSDSYREIWTNSGDWVQRGWSEDGRRNQVTVSSRNTADNGP